MIELKTRFGKTSVHISGSGAEIATDTSIAIKAIHDAIKKSSETSDAPQFFREFVTEQINEDEFWEHKEQKKENTENPLFSLIQKMHELGLI